MHTLGDIAKYKLLLTGTVITNREIDVFSQYRFLNPQIFGTSFYKFRGRYFYMTGYGNYTPVFRSERGEEFLNKLTIPLKRSSNMNNNIFELADTLKALKAKKDELNKELKTTTAAIEKIDLALSEAMAEDECERFSRNGSTFYLTSRTYASPQSGKKEEMISALKDNGFGDIVTETVNANTLASFIKEQTALCEELPSWITDVISVYEKVSVGIRKS